MKDELIKARVSRQMKQAIERMAQERGESEAVIVREALNALVMRDAAASNTPPLPAQPPTKPVNYKNPRKK